MTPTITAIPPQSDDGRYLQNVYLQCYGEGMRLWLEPMQLIRLQPTGSSTSAREQEYVAREGE